MAKRKTSAAKAEESIVLSGPEGELYRIPVSDLAAHRMPDDEAADVRSSMAPATPPRPATGGMTVNINFAGGGPPTVTAGADVAGYMLGGSGALNYPIYRGGYQILGPSVAAVCGGTGGRCSGASMKTGIIPRDIVY